MTPRIARVALTSTLLALMACSASHSATEPTPAPPPPKTETTTVLAPKEVETRPTPAPEAADVGGVARDEPMEMASDEAPAAAAAPSMDHAPAPSRAAKSAPRAKRAAPGMAEERAVSRSFAAGAGVGGGRAVAAPAMKAGRHDDNKQYNRFLSFLSENQGLVVYPVDINERLVVRVLDRDGKSVPNCDVRVRTTGGQELAKLTTYADGSTQFFPAAASAKDAKEYTVEAKCAGGARHGQLRRDGLRATEIHLASARQVPQHVPVDIAIVLDTTGSMGGQIDRLKSTLQAINFQLSQLATQPDIRFGLVAYRDRGDDYVTQVTQFTGDVGAFQQAVDRLDADGGGDGPEDLQSALDDAMHKLSWRSDAVRVGFVVSDVIPHTDYGQRYTYESAMREALERGIKWNTVGAGGLDRAGEVIFRQIAQFSMGEYVFVTQGEGGNAEGGTGEASHHVGSNYKTENLDQAMVRIVRRELSYLTDTPKDFDDTIVAEAQKPVARDQILAPAVAEALRQLVDYSSLKLAPKTPVAIVPIAAPKRDLKEVAEYLSEQMTLTASRNDAFQVVERDFNALGQELKVQLSDLFDPAQSVPIGKMVGAEVLIVAKLQPRGDGADLFARLVRVSSGEVLSVAKVTFTSGALAAR